MSGGGGIVASPVAYNNMLGLASSFAAKVP